MSSLPTPAPDPAHIARAVELLRAESNWTWYVDDLLAPLRKELQLEDVAWLEVQRQAKARAAELQRKDAAERKAADEARLRKLAVGRRSAELVVEEEARQRARETVAGATDRQRKLVRTPLSDVEARRMEWLWADRIPLGGVTLLAGRGGEGKSTWTAWLAARATLGELQGDVIGATEVLIVGHEDDAATVLKPRLLAAGADVEHVSVVRVQPGEDGARPTMPMLPLDLPRLREAVEETGARLVVIDPLSSLIDGSLDRVRDVRTALDPLAELAGELGIAVVAVLHFRKGSGHVSDLVSGSHAFRDAARQVLLVATDPETGNRVVTINKANYSEDHGSFAFRLESVDVPLSDGGAATVGRTVDAGLSSVTVADLVQREQEAASLGPKMAELLAVVARHPEGLTVEQVVEESRDLDSTTARRYLSRAARDGRIRRMSRGLYGPLTANETPRGGVVASVATVPLPWEGTHKTHVSTPARGVSPEAEAVRSA